eukprot:snap_masked-scaffold_6-processed-gene-11.17-mRNA-1 protein AED:0.82 eAED:1.00 QI:0/-1/0/1/-1/1/1/0/210
MEVNEENSESATESTMSPYSKIDKSIFNRMSVSYSLLILTKVGGALSVKENLLKAFIPPTGRIYKTKKFALHFLEFRMDVLLKFLENINSSELLAEGKVLLFGSFLTSSICTNLADRTLDIEPKSNTPDVDFKSSTKIGSYCGTLFLKIIEDLNTKANNLGSYVNDDLLRELHESKLIFEFRVFSRLAISDEEIPSYFETVYPIYQPFMD